MRHTTYSPLNVHVRYFYATSAFIRFETVSLVFGLASQTFTVNMADFEADIVDECRNLEEQDLSVSSFLCLSLLIFIILTLL